MAAAMKERDGEAFNAENPPQEGRLVVKWIELQPDASHARYTCERLDSLLLKAAQPWHSSKNACNELCHFVEQCRNSQSSFIREVVLSKHTTLRLFSFYIEWNEKSQNRQTKQVLELVASLICHLPDQKLIVPIKESILLRIVSIITHQAAQPLVKPAFKALDLFLNKRTLLPQEVIEAYDKSIFPRSSANNPESEGLVSWDRFISGIFDWMTLPDISPAAGKCLVTLFGQVKSTPSNYIPDSTLLWQRWIRNGLDKDPSSLENVKNYLFPPLFKSDRPGSILFLEDLNRQKPLSDLKTMRELNAHSLLQLAAMEAGKKAGLVEELDTIKSYKATKKASAVVVLQEDVIGELATCEVDTVRSLAFSVLVASPSPLRPFSVTALDILQSQMEVLYADTDAKFRTDTLSNTRKMIERLRGTTSYLNRELGNLSFKSGLDPSTMPQEAHKLYDQTSKLLCRHEEFIEWYMEFLLGELVPTASYQRHITGLKAIGLLLRSGILNCYPSQSLASSNNATAWPYNIDFFTAWAMRLLLDLLMDPFEDVRGSAAAVLKLAPIEKFAFGSVHQGSSYHKAKLLRRNTHSSILDHQISERQTALEHKMQRDKGLQSLTTFIALAEDLAKRTGRADYADGAARCYELLYTISSSNESRLKLVENLVHDLEAKIYIAEQNLAQAVHNAPVHGTFAALNLIWETIDLATVSRDSQSGDMVTSNKEWERLQLLMLSLCSRIWKEVKEVLCNDSPEGHLPQGLDDIKTVDTKDVLSYSFRAIHESSNLMRSMASKTKLIWQDGSATIPLESFKGIGRLTFEQLSTLRHRGAFSTVALTFARCCQLTQTKQASGKVLGCDLLETWYQGTLQCIFQQASTTRRSAGIPTMMTSILSANANRPAFNDVMTELASLARRPVELLEKDETNLPQVHAMNCLKEIFKSSTLGKKAESHIAECLQLAADSLSSEIWAIRNCGLLLLRSLIDCLFGTSESKNIAEAGWDGRSIRLSYDRYPYLPEILLKLLDTSAIHSEAMTAPTIGAVESVFPALDIIRRAGPPSTHRDEIFTLVAKHLSSRIWHVREIAARTICTLLLHEDWLPAVVTLVKSPQQSRNQTHGILLAVKFILERRLELDPRSASDGLLSIVSILKKSKTSDVSRVIHPEILAAHLEVDNTIAKIILSQPINESKGDSTQTTQMIASHIFVDDVVEEFAFFKNYLRMSAETPGIASLCNAIVRRAIYAAALSGNEIVVQTILRDIAIYNTDIALTALDCLPIAWKSHTSVKSLSGLSRAYINLLNASKNPEICACICYELADVLDIAFASMEGSDPTTIRSSSQSDIALNGIANELGFILPSNDSPSFSNARIRISGFLAIQEHASKEHSNTQQEGYMSQMRAWGQLLWQCGKASNDFDTRHAAASALYSFYNRQCITPHFLDNEGALYPLLALYDTLNDDDDEIRDLSALTVSRLLQKSVVPLAARVELVNYCQRLYGSSPLFAWSAVCRVTGNDLHASETELPIFEPAQAQFSRALKDDDSLFVEEEQNLFIDEVRETHLWAHTIKDVDLNSTLNTDVYTVWAQPYAALNSWVTDGLAIMTDLVDREDGPLGWTSKPAVFAACMRVLLSAKAITRFNERRLASRIRIQDPSILMADSVPGALERFTQLGREKNIHGSLLLGV